MDLQKEREAFECEFKQTDYYIAHGDLSTLMLCDDQYALDDVQVSFEMWQAAKAQAVPEGFVLVEKAKLMQIIGSVSMIEPITRGNPYMDSVKRELTAITDVVKTVIKAQEPAK